MQSSRCPDCGMLLRSWEQKTKGFNSVGVLNFHCSRLVLGLYVSSKCPDCMLELHPDYITGPIDTGEKKYNYTGIVFPILRNLTVFSC